MSSDSDRPHPTPRIPPSTPAPRSTACGIFRSDDAGRTWIRINDDGHQYAWTGNRRAMGAKVGTGGSAGVAWLEKRASKNVFPELWTARSHV